MPTGRPQFRDVDRDSLAKTFSRLRPRVALDLPFCRELELPDSSTLHPDGLAAQVPALSKLLEARDAVGDPSRMRRLVAESGLEADLGDTNVSSDPVPRVETTEADLLDAIVEGRDLGGALRIARGSADPEFDRMVSEIVGGAVDRTDYAQQERWRAAIDAEFAARTRSILHHSGFRAIEAAWRSLRALVMRAETGGKLRIRVLDVTLDALLEDAARDPGSSTLERLVVDEARGTPGAEPFGLLVVDPNFRGGEDDVRVLAHLARVAERAEAPCLVGLERTFWAGESIDWQELEALSERARSLPGAGRLALALPSILLRLPYGPETNPIDSIAFDEAAGSDREFLWGSSAYALAEVACETVAASGRAAALAKFSLLEDRVLHVYRRDGEMQSAGPTDRLLFDSEIVRLRSLGMAPVAAVRGRDAVWVASFRSVMGAPLFPE